MRSERFEEANLWKKWKSGRMELRKEDRVSFAIRSRGFVKGRGVSGDSNLIFAIRMGWGLRPPSLKLRRDLR